MPPKDVESVEIVHASEQWCEYHLSDGTILKLRPVVSEVWKVTGERDDEGNPKYIIQSTIVTAVSSQKKGPS